MSNTFDNYPANYLLYNKQLSKNLTVVMEIEGVGNLYGISPTFTQVRYGDPNIVYGTPGLVYGGLRALGNLKPYMVLDSSFSINQKVEPEEGRGNIGILNITLIDYNGEISKLVSPGIVIPEILFNPQFRIWVGFAQTSFPGDFLLLFSGYCTQVTCPQGRVTFQLSDATAKVRQPLFNAFSSLLTMNASPTDTLINVQNTQGFYKSILGPNGTYDSHVFTYIVIDSEIMIYDSVMGLMPTTVTVTRAQLGSVASSHSAGPSTTVTNTMLLGSQAQGINFIDLCLKLMLSGWNGPCETNIPVSSFNYIDQTLMFQANAFLIQSQDAIRDLGLSVGDYFTITGATNPLNNISGVITGFGDSVITNQVIFTNKIFQIEPGSSAATAFRSQYDTLPLGAGLKMRMRDVDVATWQFVKNTYFASGIYNISMYYNSAVMGTDTIPTDILLPMGCYTISRFGRQSIAVCKPPLPGIGKLVPIDFTTVIHPDQIQVQRATNARTFYNLISYQYNLDPSSGNFTTTNYYLDTASLNEFGGQTSQLPIVAPGLRDDLAGGDISQIRGRALLNRYKSCCIKIQLTVNWSAGSLIEVSDIVKLTDNGNLKIMNFATGERDLGVQLFEVIDRTYNLYEGNVKLTLLGGLGFDVNSRFALYSPSSQLNSGSTSTLLRLVPSYGQTLISNEMAKWTPYVGQKIVVHDFAYVHSAQTTIIGINASDPTALDVSPTLPFTPAVGYIIDIPPYPNPTTPKDQQEYKLLYVHLTPSVPVTSGVSSTSFNIGSGDVAKFTDGNTIILRNTDWSTVSPEVKVLSVVGTLVTVASTLGFTPDNTFTVEGIGFHDGTSFYRYT